MPCRSDYLEPTAQEEESVRVAKHLIYMHKMTGEPIEQYVIKAADHVYGDVEHLHDMTAALCAAIKKLTIENLNTVVYDGKRKEARALADWWDEHRAADVKRQRDERRRKADNARLKLAKSKLSPRELDLIRKEAKGQL